MALAIAITTMGLTLLIGFLFFLQIEKIKKEILETQEQIHQLNNEINRLKHITKKKYYSRSNIPNSNYPKGKQLIQG